VTIRVLVVENEALVRQGLVRVLALDPEIEIAGEARDGAEGLRMIAERRPDVVLLDVRMPGMGGIDVLRALAGTAPTAREPGYAFSGNAPSMPYTLPGRTVPCLLLTTFDDPEVALEGIRAGAKGFLLKDVSFEVLASAIRQVAAGGTFARPAVTERILRGLEAVRAHPDLDGQHERLTERETEVVRLLAGGYSNAEIARALGVAERTVKNHVSNVLAKLYVRDRTRAVLKALGLGLI
jgi:DNA-binding NarL/FixJ family response regulator